MRPLLGASLLALMVTISTGTAARAEESPAAPAATESTAAAGADDKAVKAKPAKKVRAAGASSKSDVAPPARFASFVVGSVVGTPVAMVRKIKQESISATKDLVGDTSNPFLLGAGGFLGVPAGIVSGFFEGPVYGVVDAWKASKDEPFSAEAFSMGDLK